MFNVSRSLQEIAVIRGGKEEFGTSLLEGAEALSSLKKIGYKPLDVLIDKEGKWTANGVPTDAHEVFSKSHTVVDTTRLKTSPHHDLAKKMDVPLFFSRGNQVHTDRENLYRLLRMQNIKVPETLVVRAKAPLEDNLFRTAWSKFHTPLVVRPLVRNPDVSSKLITMYEELESTIRDMHARGVDLHILTYKKVPTISVAALPHFRGEELYFPLWVETFSGMKELPHDTASTRVHYNAPEYRKKQIADFARHVYVSAGLQGPVVIDIVPSGNNSYMVVNIEERPTLTKDSRFSKALASTGVDLGQYIHEQVKRHYDLAR